MSALKHAFLQAFLPLSCAAVLGVARHSWAQEAPVERPSVDRPALPQPSHEPAAPVEHPATAQPAPAQPSNASTKDRSNRRSAGFTSGGVVDRHASFLYLGAGLGLIDGLGGGREFERSNPAFTGLLGVEVPLNAATGLGFELNVDFELPSSGDVASYDAALLRARLGRMLTPNARLWGAAGIGAAGYVGTSLAGTLAAGSTLLFAPKFGLDLSANLTFVGAQDARVYSGRAYGYDGGFVLLLAVKAMFELHRTR